MKKRRESRQSLEPRVLGFIQAHRLLSGQSRLVVAVSGGQDSVCLLHILIGLQPELDIKLHVAHLNHQLRGEESAADAQFVARLADQLGLPATIEEGDVKAYQAGKRLSLEEAAREVRYRFLAQVAKSIGTDRVAVGHTIDDNTETILMHLIRGTGTRGLRGLQPGSRWQSPDTSLMIIRPLLQVSRQETADYCRDHQLIPRLDASNLSLSPLRNRIRQQLLPLLRSYNPRVVEALLRAAGIVGNDLAFIEQEGARIWQRIAQREGCSVTLDKEGLLELPTALQRYLLRKAIEELLGNLKDIETRHIEAMMTALTKPAGKRISLPEGLIFVVEYAQYRLALEATTLSPLPALEGEFALKIPGKTLVPGWQVKTSIMAPEEVTDIGKDFTVYLDLDKAGRKIFVRPRQPGDRFQPLGMSQLKRLGEFMIDAKIPRAWRQRVPILHSPQQVIWVVGWRIDDRVKVTASTKRVLRLEFEPATNAEGSQ